MSLQLHEPVAPFVPGQRVVAKEGAEFDASMRGQTYVVCTVRQGYVELAGMPGQHFLAGRFVPGDAPEPAEHPDTVRLKRIIRVAKEMARMTVGSDDGSYQQGMFRAVRQVLSEADVPFTIHAPQPARVEFSDEGTP